MEQLPDAPLRAHKSGELSRLGTGCHLQAHSGTCNAPRQHRPPPTAVPAESVLPGRRPARARPFPLPPRGVPERAHIADGS